MTRDVLLEQAARVLTLGCDIGLPDTAWGEAEDIAANLLTVANEIR